MNEASQEPSDLSLSQAVVTEVGRLDQGIAQAVAAAKNAGLAQGLIVSLLYGHLTIQGNAMVTSPTQE